jgi:hypothetical protein
MQKNKIYLKNHFAIVIIGLILVMGICLPVCHAEETMEHTSQFSPVLLVSETVTNFSTPQVIHEGYYPNEWVMTSSGSDLNITLFESNANQMVINFREKYNAEIHRAFWVKPTFNTTEKDSVVGAGIIIHPDGVVNQIEIYNSDPDTVNQDAIATKLGQWKVQEYSAVKEKLNPRSSADGAAPVALGYRSGSKESKPWGETSWTSNYYYDSTSSKSIVYLFVDTEAIMTPGIVHKQQGHGGWTEPTKDFVYTLQQDWTATSGTYNPIPGLALADHKPIAMSVPTTATIELGIPASLKLNLDIKFPGEKVLDQTSVSTPAWRHEFDPVFHNDVVIQTQSSDYGSEIQTYYSNLNCNTNYALATVTMKHKNGFTKGSVLTGWEYGPNDDNAYSTNVLIMTYTC